MAAQISDPRAGKVESKYVNVNFVPLIVDGTLLVGMRVLALRPIKPGEQLLVSYGTKFWRMWEKAQRK